MKFASSAVVSVAALTVATTTTLSFPSGVNGFQKKDPPSKDYILHQLRGGGGGGVRASPNSSPGINQKAIEHMVAFQRILSAGGGGPPPDPTCPNPATAPLQDRTMLGYNPGELHPVVVDGNPIEWQSPFSASGANLNDLSKRDLNWLYTNQPYFIGPMYEGFWGPDQTTHPWVSNAFGRFDCANNQVCFLVITTKDASGNFLYSLTGAENHAKQKGVDGDLDGTIRNVLDPTNLSKIVGWEGCFNYQSNADGCYGFALHGQFCSYGTTCGGGTTGFPGGNSNNAIFQIHTRCTCDNTHPCQDTTDCYNFYCNAYVTPNVCVAQAPTTPCACIHDSECAPTTPALCTEPRCIGHQCYQVDKIPAPSGCGTPPPPESTCVDTTCANTFTGDPICARKTCVDLDNDGTKTCEFQAISANAGDACGDSATINLSGGPAYTPYDDCDLGFQCAASGNCAHAWKSDGTSGCEIYVGSPITYHSDCYELKCKACTGAGCQTGETRCQPEPKAATAYCPSIPLNGDCDAGTQCGAALNCEQQTFMSDTTKCGGDPDGCCDAQNYCSGTSYDCVENYQDQGTTCRSCTSGTTCLVNPINPDEVCTGSSKSCPKDKIFEDHYCLKAGQTAPAGTLNVTIRDVSVVENDPPSYSVCVAMDLSDSWDLDPNSDNGGTEAVKIYIGTVPPTSNPGSYPYKFSYTFFDNGPQEVCWPLTDFTTTCGALYFAFHFDVVGGSTETAWARECKPDKDNGLDSLLNPKNWYNKKNTQIGWGEYFKLECTCASPSCSSCAVQPNTPQ